MSERRKMGVGDWMDAAINVVIGVFLGSVIYGLAQLVASGSWLMAMILILLGGGLFLIMVLSDKLPDRLFHWSMAILVRSIPIRACSRARTAWRSCIMRFSPSMTASF